MGALARFSRATKPVPSMAPAARATTMAGEAQPSGSPDATAPKTMATAVTKRPRPARIKAGYLLAVVDHGGFTSRRQGCLGLPAGVAR